MDKTMCGILDIKENTFMKRKSLTLLILISAFLYISVSAQIKHAQNPIIYADVPDMSIVRVGDTILYEQYNDAHESGRTYHEIKRSCELENSELCIRYIR